MMRARCWATGLLIGGGLGVACAQGGGVEAAFQQGATALKAGHMAEAEGAFRRAVGEAPGMAEAHLDLGLVLGREGKLAEAETELREAVRLDPHAGGAHLFLGVFEYQQGKTAEAEQNLQAEAVANPASVEAQRWLGIVELAEGKAEAATGPLDTAVKLAPDDLDLLELQGKAHSQVAAASYARMARLNPDAWQVHAVRADLLESEGRNTEAVTEFEAALARGGQQNPDLWEGLGDCYRRMNELGKARTAYAEEVKLAPANPIAMYNLGSTMVEDGQPAEGVALLEKMMAVYVGVPAAEFYRGRGLAGMGRDTDAVEWLERAAQDGHGSEVTKRAEYELSRLYRKMDKPAEAAKALALYTQMRDAEAKNATAQEADWRKLNGTR